jgi:excisionase family DNA binding protein
MQFEYPFSERFDFLELKLNKILDQVHDLGMQIVESKKPFLSMEEATKYLNVTKHTIYGWTHNNKLPYYKAGRRIYFSIDEINNWVLNKENKIRSNEEIKSLAATKIMTDRLKGKSPKKYLK